MVVLDMNGLDQRAKAAGANEILIPLQGIHEYGDGDVERYVQFAPYLKKGTVWMPFKKGLRCFIFNGRDTWDDKSARRLWCQVDLGDDNGYITCFPDSVKDVIGSNIKLDIDDVIMVTFVSSKEQIINMSRSKALYLQCKAHLFKEGVLAKEWAFSSDVMNLQGILRQEESEDDDLDEDEVVGTSGRDGSQFHCHAGDCAYCTNEDCDRNYYYDW